MSAKPIAFGLFIMLCLCACSGKHGIYSNTIESSPVSADIETLSQKSGDLIHTVDDTMTALKNLEMELFNTNTNNRQIMVDPWGGENVEYTFFGELCDENQSGGKLAYRLDEEIVKNLSWEILDIAQYKDSAKIKLAITNVDMEGIFQKAQIDSVMINEIKKIPAENTRTIKVTLKAEKQREKWILLIDMDFVNAISANLWVIDTDDYFHEIQDYDDISNITFRSRAERLELESRRRNSLPP